MLLKNETQQFRSAYTDVVHFVLIGVEPVHFLEGMSMILTASLNETFTLVSSAIYCTFMLRETRFDRTVSYVRA